jgi:hypothetical protein
MRRHQPTFLVLNLKGFVGSIDASLLHFIAAATSATYKIGPGGRTRVLAIGRTATKLNEVLQIAQLASVLGGGVFPDLDVALEIAGPEAEGST